MTIQIRFLAGGGVYSNFPRGSGLVNICNPVSDGYGTYDAGDSAGRGLLLGHQHIRQAEQTGAGHAHKPPGRHHASRAPL